MKSYKTLKRRNDFSRLYRNSNSQKGRSAVILVRPNRQKDTRIGFSVSAKVGNAVTRNRTRRRLREAVFRYNESIVKGYDVVFVARHQDKEMPFAELVKDIGYLLSKSGLLDKDRENGQMKK